jgi:hypothetical protein
MIKLVGSEKQVRWAEDIRQGYMKTAEILKEAIEIYKDTAQEENIVKDPVFGDYKEKRYAKQTNNSHTAAYHTAVHLIGKEKAKEIEQKFWARAEKLKDEEHGDRMTQREKHEALLAAVENILENEDSAKYYIDHR